MRDPLKQADLLRDFETELARAPDAGMILLALKPGDGATEIFALHVSQYDMACAVDALLQLLSTVVSKHGSPENMVRQLDDIVKAFAAIGGALAKEEKEHGARH